MGVRKNNACINTVQITLISLKRIFSADKGNEIPKEKIANNITNTGKKTTVIVGVNWKTIMNTTTIVDSINIIKNAVRFDDIAKTSLFT